VLFSHVDVVSSVFAWALSNSPGRFVGAFVAWRITWRRLFLTVVPSVLSEIDLILVPDTIAEQFPSHEFYCNFCSWVARSVHEFLFVEADLFIKRRRSNFSHSLCVVYVSY